MSKPKCGGATNGRGGVIRQCNLSARYENQGFCCCRHKEEAQKHAPQAFDDFVAGYMFVMSNPDFLNAYNKNVRTMFYNAVVAGKEAAEAQYVKHATLKMGQHASLGWQKAHAEYNDQQALQQQVDTIKAYKSGVKRKQSEESVVDQLLDAKPEVQHRSPVNAGVERRRLGAGPSSRVISSDESDEEYDVPVHFRRLRRRGTDCVVEEIVEEVQAPHQQPVHVGVDPEVARLNDAVAHAAQQPLPEDDDEMDWD
jgi:hypothetical protein